MPCIVRHVSAWCPHTRATSVQATLVVCRRTARALAAGGGRGRHAHTHNRALLCIRFIPRLRCTVQTPVQVIASLWADACSTRTALGPRIYSSSTPHESRSLRSKCSGVGCREGRVRSPPDLQHRRRRPAAPMLKCFSHWLLLSRLVAPAQMLT